jgi:hypothetical protein
VHPAQRIINQLPSRCEGGRRGRGRGEELRKGRTSLISSADFAQNGHEIYLITLSFLIDRILFCIDHHVYCPLVLTRESMSMMRSSSRSNLSSSATGSGTLAELWWNFGGRNLGPAYVAKPREQNKSSQKSKIKYGRETNQCFLYKTIFRINWTFYYQFTRDRVTLI